MSNNIQSDNKKFRGKYILIMLACMIVGGIVGSCVSFFSHDGSGNVFDSFAAGLEQLLTVVAPWGIPVVSAALLIPAFGRMRRARALLAAWDGEDEDAAEAIEACTDRVLLLCHLLMLSIMLFIGMCLVYLTRLETILNLVLLMVSVVLFLADLIIAVRLQQQVVDLIRTMNPEKEGSVYDLKFQEKWLDSCDENERRQIGEASYKAFTAGSKACASLWAVLILTHLMFGTGLLPIAVVLGIWAVLLITYHVNAAKAGRRKK